MFPFLWQVSKEGYRWVETSCGQECDETSRDDTKCWLLTTGQPQDLQGLVRPYQPLKEYPALFRVFAETSATQEGIVDFANAYGMLTRGETNAHYRMYDTEKPGTSFIALGERLSLWQEAIRTMQEAVTLWGFLEEENQRELARYIKWQGRSRVSFQSQNSVISLIASEEYHAERLQWFKPEDVVMPAKLYLQNVVNEYQAGRVAPHMLWSPEDSELRERLIPNDLLGALWLQFALGIDGKKQYRRCAQCGQWFEILAKVLKEKRSVRSDKLFCTNACRQRAYNLRKKHVTTV